MWSTDWYRNRREAESRLLEAIKKAKLKSELLPRTAPLKVEPAPPTMKAEDEETEQTAQQKAADSAKYRDAAKHFPTNVVPEKVKFLGNRDKNQDTAQNSPIPEEPEENTKPEHKYECAWCHGIIESTERPHGLMLRNCAKAPDGLHSWSMK